MRLRFSHFAGFFLIGYLGLGVIGKSKVIQALPNPNLALTPDDESLGIGA